MTRSDKHKVSVAKHAVLGDWNITPLHMEISIHLSQENAGIFYGILLLQNDLEQFLPTLLVQQPINQSINHTPHFTFCRGRGPLSLATVLSGFSFRERLWTQHQTHAAGKMQGENFLLAVRGFQS